MKCKYSAADTYQAYETFISQYTSTQPSNDDIKLFVLEHFDPVGLEYEQWTPPDLKASPLFLNDIASPWYRAWASDLNQYWATLGRKQVNDVTLNPDRYSIIPMPNPVVFESESYREFYYWDNYWTVLGMLTCEMHDVRTFYVLIYVY